MFIIDEIISSLCKLKYSSSLATGILSTPGAPLFALTLLIASFKFSSLKISLINSYLEFEL